MLRTFAEFFSVYGHSEYSLFTKKTRRERFTIPSDNNPLSPSVEYTQHLQNLDFKIRREYQKNHLCVCRR